MNTLLSSGSGDLWQVAGWTMLHFLWLGALAGLAAGAFRLVLRRAAANVRYAAALVCLAVLAALPVGTAAWVGAKLQVADRPGQAMRVAVIESAARPQTVAGHGDGGDAPVIDLAVNKLPVAVSNVTDTVPMVATNFAPDSNGPLPLVVFAIESAARYLPWLWLLGTPLTFLLLATGVVGAERLRRASRVIEDGPIAAACARLIESLRIGRRVTVAVCERIAAPVLVGIVRPIILLPPAALMGWSPDEIEMVLLHELAHVRRWDNLVNLAQRLIESLLFFHPAVWLVSNWVRREREACCDAVVVGSTNRPHAYAELLVAFAARLSEPSEPGRPRPRVGGFSRGRG
ncbi:MAG: M56 family metallopeptidase, partial [Pirellulales bacterium]